MVGAFPDEEPDPKLRREESGAQSRRDELMFLRRTRFRAAVEESRKLLRFAPPVV